MESACRDLVYESPIDELIDLAFLPHFPQDRVHDSKLLDGTTSTAARLDSLNPWKYSIKVPLPRSTAPVVVVMLTLTVF